MIAPSATGAPAPYVLDATTGRPRSTTLDDCLARVLRGELVVIPGGLQRLGFFDRVRNATLDAIASETSPEVAAQVAAAGFEQLHRFVEGPQLYGILERLTAMLTPDAPAVVRAVTKRLLRHEGPIYVGGKLWVRFLVPHAIYLEHRALFSTRPGHLEPLLPHRDSWFTNPFNCIGLWIAVGRTRAGNSMVLHQARWGRPVDRDTHATARPGQDFGPATAIEIDPGDLLLFSGEHVHASEQNVTDETRFVLTTRFTVGAPRYGEGLFWKPYRDLRLLGTPLAGLATLRSRLSAARARQLQATVRAIIRRRAAWLYPVISRSG